jgi:hypothetical protein
MKLFLHRQPNTSDFFQAVIQIPVDISFMSLALLVAVVKEHPQEGILYFVMNVILCLLATVLWRKAEEYYLKKRAFLSLTITIVSSAGSLYAVKKVLHLLGII